MDEVGVRELKAGLSEVLRQVANGQTVRVTRNGRHVADIVPAGAPPPIDPRIAHLVERGTIAPAARTGKLERAQPSRTGKSASQVILDERDEEYRK